MNAKQRVVIAYSDLSQDLRARVNKSYPGGFRNQLMTIPRQDGTSYKAFTLDTGDKLYLIKVEDRYLKSADELMDELEAYEPDEDEFDY